MGQNPADSAQSAEPGLDALRPPVREALGDEEVFENLRDVRGEVLNLARWFGAVVMTGCFVVGLLWVGYEPGSLLWEIVHTTASLLASVSIVPVAESIETITAFSTAALTGLLVLLAIDPYKRIQSLYLAAGTAVVLGGWALLGYVSAPDLTAPYTWFAILTGLSVASLTQLPELLAGRESESPTYNRAASALYVVAVVVVGGAILQNVLQGYILTTIALGIPSVAFLYLFDEFLSFESGIDIGFAAGEGGGKSTETTLFRIASDPYVQVPHETPALEEMMEREAVCSGLEGFPLENTREEFNEVGYTFDVGHYNRNRVRVQAPDFPGGWLPTIAEYAALGKRRLWMRIQSLRMEHWLLTSPFAVLVAVSPVGPSAGQLTNRRNGIETDLKPATVAYRLITTDVLFALLDFEKWATQRNEDAYPLPLAELEVIARAAKKEGATICVLGAKADHLEPIWYEVCDAGDEEIREYANDYLSYLDHSDYQDGMIGADYGPRGRALPAPEDHYEAFTETVNYVVQSADPRLAAFLRNLGVKRFWPAYAKTTRDQDDNIVPDRELGRLQPVGHLHVLRNLEL